MKFQAVIFDMDGLLVASEAVWERAEQQMIADKGHVFTKELREAIVGLRVDAFVAELKRIFGLPDSVQQLTDELNGRMEVLIPQFVQPQPGAREIVEYVVQQGIPHAIASNSSRRIIDVTLAAQGWADVFEVRCSADDEAHGKPAPDVYLTAARKLGIAPAGCLGIEDSPNGARGVVNAGITCYVVPDASHATPAMFADITPHVFASLHDVLNLLRED